MRLPVALQTALERSERQFQEVLSRLGLTREKLAGVAEKIRTRTKTKPPARPAACMKRRAIHV
jgi:hypothetical protein